MWEQDVIIGLSKKSLRPGGAGLVTAPNSLVLFHPMTSQLPLDFRDLVHQVSSNSKGSERVGTGRG